MFQSELDTIFNCLSNEDKILFIDTVFKSSQEVKEKFIIFLTDNSINFDKLFIEFEKTIEKYIKKYDTVFLSKQIEASQQIENDSYLVDNDNNDSNPLLDQFEIDLNSHFHLELISHGEIIEFFASLTGLIIAFQRNYYIEFETNTLGNDDRYIDESIHQTDYYFLKKKRVITIPEDFNKEYL